MDAQICDLDEEKLSSWIMENDNEKEKIKGKSRIQWILMKRQLTGKSIRNFTGGKAF